jgi:hypothetical protein
VNNATPAPAGQTFADFIYAVVIGVAFADIKLTAGVPALILTSFLLVVVLEDFFLYQTQVKPLTEIFRFTTFSSMVFEVGILLSWFLAFLSRDEPSPNLSFGCLSAFFLLKWLASAKHLSSTPTTKRWVLHRDHLFLMSVIAAVALILTGARLDLNVCSVRIDGAWPIYGAVWLVQTLLWWYVVRAHSTTEPGQ